MTLENTALQLWFDQPASEWNEALPLGNGFLGAMVYGGSDSERIELNEGTLWSGFPRDSVNYEAQRHLAQVREWLALGEYCQAQDLIERLMLGGTPEAFQPLGTLTIEADQASETADYLRTLNLEDGLFQVYGLGKRQAFISYPDRVLAYRWEGADTLPDLTIRLTSPHPFEVSRSGVGLTLRGQLPSHVSDNYLGDHPESLLYEEGLGLRFTAALSVVPEVGQVVFQPDGSLLLQGCRAFTLLLTAASNFRGWDQQPDPDDPEPALRCQQVLERANMLGWTALHERHVSDHRAMMGRVSLELEAGQFSNLPLNQRLMAYRDGTPDPALEALFFQYGRYLLMASSRPGGQPANLQGLWNPHLQPPWFSDYTININTQMNYWPTEVCALGECAEPLTRMLAEMAESGKRTARIHYGAAGWCAHHNTDLWRMTTPTNGEASWAMWPLAGAWLSRQLWEQHLYRPDPAFLQETAWPILNGAAQFVLDWLVEDEHGRLGTSPSTSPENQFLDAQGRKCSVANASAIDLGVVRDLLGIAVQASQELELDAELRERALSALEKLAPFPVAQDGRLLEWSTDLHETEPGHRHFSPLYGLFPADLFDDQLRQAAQKTLEHRLAHGAGQTSWSAAWAACLWARLGNGKQAHQLLQRLLSRSTLPNLLSSHPPFQIDGNFGASAAVVEMLLQNHGDCLELLPALPTVWNSGTVRGLRAWSGVSVDLEWQNHQLERAILRASQPLQITLKYGSVQHRVELAEQQTVKLDSKLNQIE